MDNSNKQPPKVLKNPLLQSANYGFPFETLRTNSLLVVASTEEASALSETTEIDSFIGQDFSAEPPPLLINSSIVNENDNKNCEQSVSLVVPSSDSGGAANQPPSSQFDSQTRILPTPTSLPPPSSTSSAALPQFFDPSRFEVQTPTTTLQSDPQERLAPPVCAIGSSSSNNNYRRGNLKKPTYAPVPGLSSTHVNQNLTLFSPSSPTLPPLQNQSKSPLVTDFSSRSQSGMSSNNNHPGGPSCTGPYGNSTTTAGTLNDSTSHGRPSSAMSSDKSSSLYRPVYHHWFYRKDGEKNWFYQKEGEMKSLWKPFSMSDSLALERAYSLPTLNEDTVVATDGGRYDVNIVKREKTAVYWEERRSMVRRCSWFSKGANESCYIPYEEEVAIKLEEEYKLGMITGIWNRKIDLGTEEVVMHNVSLITHQIKSTNVSYDVATDSSIPSQLRPRMVKRGGFDDFDIEDGEPEKVDHLLFLVHGVGQFCDLKFRSIIEVVDEFRSISLQLTQSHFQESCELGEVNRIEILPVSWHKALHSEDTGIDRRLKNITLPSIPRLRDFSNDTILDVLFYTSPVFCQVIINAVVSEMNRLYGLFCKRNPNFGGKVSIGGHSLGSIIVFDLLSNQPSTPCQPEPNVVDDLAEEYDKRLTTMTRRISVVTIGKAGTGQPLVKYPRLNFNPTFFFAFGAPIGCFVATRSNEILGEDFKFPTCKGFFNIFHPYDPIAYRMEPLIIPSLSTVKPVQIPHHKGRKRMHLELKDTVSHVGQRLIDTVKNTWNMVYHLAVNKSMDAAESVIQQELSHVLQSSEALSKKPVNPNLVPAEPVNETTNVKVGCINEGRRVDYVLQETPVEYFNEYLFALASHLCYWTSRDTVLLVLKEIYGEIGIYTDNQIPQTILPFDITDGETTSNENLNVGVNYNPTTASINNNLNLGSSSKSFQHY